MGVDVRIGIQSWYVITHDGSMGLEKMYLGLVDFYGKFVGKYTSPIDPMRKCLMVHDSKTANCQIGLQDLLTHWLTRTQRTKLGASSNLSSASKQRPAMPGNSGGTSDRKVVPERISEKFLGDSPPKMINTLVPELLRKLQKLQISPRTGWKSQRVW